MCLVAEWVSVKEIKALQSACMLVSIKAREKEYEEFLSDPDDQVQKEKHVRRMAKILRRCANSEPKFIAANSWVMVIYGRFWASRVLRESVRRQNKSRGTCDDSRPEDLKVPLLQCVEQSGADKLKQ